MKNESLVLKNVSYFDYREGRLKKAENIAVSDGKISFRNKGEERRTLDCSDYVMMPSFVQLHTHLCQHLYKGLAEDLSLFDWLKKHILPYENSLDEEGIRLSCRLALYELIDSGTTLILDMGTFRYQEIIFDEIEKSGITGFSGNILLDRRVGKWNNSLDDYMSYSEELIRGEKKKGNAKYALNPRFFPGITRSGIKRMLSLKEKYDLILHTHASETKDENEFAQRVYGKTNIEAMDSFGMLSERTVIAHCIHLTENDFMLLRKSKTTVCHCPSSNMKLGSGIAGVERMIKNGINAGLGSDGAPCNNNMSQLVEMRMAGLLQKVKNGSKSMEAGKIFKMATHDGLKPLRMQEERGIIEEGMSADFLLMRRDGIHTAPFEGNPFSAVIYSAYPSDVEYVFSKGKMLKEKGRVTVYDRGELIEGKKRFLKDLLLDRL